jgi:periplasmic protein TonB
VTSPLAVMIIAAAQAPAPRIAISNTAHAAVVLPPQSLPPAAMQAPKILAGPEERMPASRYVSPLDYPADAAGAEGSVGFALTIDPSGRVIGCAITCSSGSPALDAATCRIMQCRARYTAVRDSNGNPVAGTIEQSVEWKGPAAR